MRKSSYYIEAAALLIIITLCLFIIFNRDSSPHKIKYSVNEQLPRNQNHAHAIKYSYPWPSCTRNVSAEKIPGFSSLPGHIQDFLYYRHCRYFPMLLDVPDLCGATPEESGNVFLLLVIKSAPWNYDRRDVLRKTWAKERLQNGVWVQRVFISGVVSTGEEQHKMNKMLQLENNEHHDILQWDFNDSFFNLTLKQVLFLEWMEKRCPHVHFMLNGDDDVFANTDNMVEYLQSLKDDDGSKHLFMGYVVRDNGPIRDPRSKYYVPVQVQESNSYPPFCPGGGILMSGFTAGIIYKMSHDITFLPVDDVYLALCLEKAGLEPVNHFGIRTGGLHIPSVKADKYDPCYYRELLLVHRFVPHQIYIMWHEIHDPDLKCGRLQNIN